MTLRANGVLGLSLRQSGCSCSCNLTRATGHLERPLIAPIRMIRSTWTYIDTSILPNRARENPRRRQPATAYPAGPVRPCVHMHASHIGGRSSSRMQKSGVGEGLRSRQVQPTLSVVEVARASVRQSHCTNAYRVLLFEFCDDVAVMMMHYVNLRKRLSLGI